MKWKHGSGRSLGGFSPFPRLVFLALFFLSGVILGQVLSRKVSPSAGTELQAYLRDYIQLESSSQTRPATVGSALVLYLRYPLLAFLLGFASVGILLLPCVTMAYGFFLSFSVCCFTATFGAAGVLVALAVFGFRTLVTLPCFFLLAVPSWEASASLASLSLGRGRHMAAVMYGKSCWIRFAVCLAVLLVGVCLEITFGPWLLHFVLWHVLG